MNCRKIKRWIPLAISSDFSLNKLSKIKDHLRLCEKCGNEYKEYLNVFSMIDELKERDSIDWDEAEWSEMIKQVTQEKIKPCSSLVLNWNALYQKSWAYIFLAFAIIAVVLFLTLPHFLQEKKTEFLTARKESIGIEPIVKLEKQEQPLKLRIPEKIASSRPVVKKKIEQEINLLKETPIQDSLVMTLVSKETGLKIIWFFNKNFEWEEKKNE
ncbi:MAG: hypothetical protein AB1410_04120 [Acidobacteriota bacterium]